MSNVTIMSDRSAKAPKEDFDDGGEGKPSGMRIGGLRFSSEINLGALIMLFTALIGLVAWAVTSANRGDQSSRDQIALQSQVTEKLADLRSSLTNGLQDLRQQIAGLPDQRASLGQIERRMADFERNMQNADGRFVTLERASIESRSDLNQLLRAAQVPLPRTSR